MQQVIHAVLASKKVLGVLAGATGRLDTGVTQRLHITAGTKGFFAGAIDKYRDHLVIVSPGFKPIGDDLHHLPGQGVQRLLNVESELPNHPVSRQMLGNQHTVGH